MKNFSLLILTIISLLFVIEIFLRLIGYQVYSFTQIEPVACSPQNWTVDSILGFKNNAGNLKCNIDTMNFSIHHLTDGSRLTSLSNKNLNSNKIIHLYGCSITWGHGLDDDATMAWMLQGSLPNYKIYNYGLGAGSNLQSFLWLRQNIENDNIPALVIVNYTWFHNMRNTFSWPWRMAWQSILNTITAVKSDSFDINLPYISVNKDSLNIKYLTKEDISYNLPLVNKLVFMNVANQIYHTKIVDNGINDFEATFLLFKNIHSLCNKHSIKLIVNGITNDESTSDMLKELNNIGICTNDVSVDFINNDDYNLNPIDNHPNKKANKYFANETLNFLNHNVLLK